MEKLKSLLRNRLFVVSVLVAASAAFGVSTEQGQKLATAVADILAGFVE